jgi:hypothetical protein
MRFALVFALAVGLAVMSGAAQQLTILTNGRNLQIPINHGLPDKPLGFTFCRLRYVNIRRARKSGWGDDYPQADYNFMVRLAELTRTPISLWNNGYPGFANVTAMDLDVSPSRQSWAGHDVQAAVTTILVALARAPVQRLIRKP